MQNSFAVQRLAVFLPGKLWLLTFQASNALQLPLLIPLCLQQDTPWLDDGFGSLVISLPAPCEGGSLVVCHNGSEKV